MSRIAYVNGHYVRHSEAAIHIEDRGYQFADGVYEVIAVTGGRLLDEGPHFDRLERSLGELAIPRPMSRRALSVVIHECVRRNRVGEGIVYLQMTRGAAPRDHAFPATAEATLVVTARNQVPAPALFSDGVAISTLPDQRWARCDIKSTALLANVLAKQRAREGGFYEAWQVDAHGFVTEGSSTNAWIVNGDGALQTRDLGPAILSGITRSVLLDLAQRDNAALVEAPFTVDEAKAAQEAFATSTTALVLPVVRIDETVIGDGRPGPLTCRLHDLYESHTHAQGAGRQRR